MNDQLKKALPPRAAEGTEIHRIEDNLTTARQGFEILAANRRSGLQIANEHRRCLRIFRRPSVISGVFRWEINF